jgi:hypothetical protein
MQARLEQYEGTTSSAPAGVVSRGFLEPQADSKRPVLEITQLARQQSDLRVRGGAHSM